MPLQAFVDKVGPVVSAAWLNVVDALKFTVFADATTKATARTALTSDAPMEVMNGGTGVRTLTDLGTALEGYIVNYYDVTAEETAAGVTPVDYSIPPFPINVMRYGALGDGITDDLAAIDNAVLVAAEAITSDSNGYVSLPPGVFMVTNQVILPNKVRLVGAGRSSTFIKAAVTFPTSTAVVKFGTTSNVFAVRLENMTVDCSSIASSIGVYSARAQEQCGLRDAVVLNFRDIGVKLDTNIGVGVALENVECYGYSGGWNDGIYLSTSSAVLSIRNCTVTGVLAATSGINALNVVLGHVDVTNLHCETVANGVYMDTNASGNLVCLSGHSACVDVLEIKADNNGNVTVHAMRPNGSTNCVNDLRTGRLIPGSVQVGFYMIGSGSGPAGAADKYCISDVVGAQGWWNVRAPIAQYAVDLFTDADTTPSVGYGNVFRTNNSGPTTITNLDEGQQGQRVTIIFLDANTTLSGASFDLSGAFTSTANDTITLVKYASKWYEVSRSVNT